MGKKGARMSVSEVLNRNVRENGPQLVSTMTLVLKVTKLYSAEHPNVREAH